MRYEAPPEHNPDFATARRWSVQYTCRCGQMASIDTKARYILTTCRSCGTKWEIGPSFCDATPYTAETAAPEEQES